MKKLRIKWFTFGFGSCLIIIVAFVAYTVFITDNSYQVDLHTYSISLPSGELMIYTHDSCSETKEYSGEHVLTFIKNDRTWETVTLDSTFSEFSKFILATSESKEIVWAIDPVNNNWIEWNTQTNIISEHRNETIPEYTEYNRYVKIDKT